MMKISSNLQQFDFFVSFISATSFIIKSMWRGRKKVLGTPKIVKVKD